MHSLFLRHRRVSWLLSALVIVAGWAVPLALPHYTVTARLDNATNELYRNHLSLIKDFVPEMGRNFKIVYSISF